MHIYLFINLNVILIYWLLFLNKYVNISLFIIIDFYVYLLIWFFFVLIHFNTSILSLLFFVISWKKILSLPIKGLTYLECDTS